MDAIAHAGDRVWQSNRGQEKIAATAPSKQTSTPTKEKRNRSGALSRAPRESLPAFISPQLASFAKAPPVGGRWVHELKLDGYRIQARVDHTKSAVQLLTRTGLDWTHRMKAVAAAVLELPVETALLDGEVVVLDSDGTTSFAKLQASFQEGAKHTLTYFVFDLLHLNGHNLRDLPLLERKKLLAEVISDTAVIERRWIPDYDRIFPSAADKANAVFVDVRAEELRLWIRGLTPEPFGVCSLTLRRPPDGDWYLDSERP